MKQLVLLLGAFLYLTPGLKSQTEFNLKLGVESWILKDEIELLGVSKHPGQFIGFDVYVEKNRLIFAPGFHYHRFSVMNEEERLRFAFEKRNNLHYFTIPLTFGYEFLDLKALNFSLLTGPEVTFFYNIDDNDIGLDDDMLHGVSAGWTAALLSELLTFGTLEVKYHYAFHPIIKIRDESKLRGWTLAAGFKF
jgi:hypothetical protein